MLSRTKAQVAIDEGKVMVNDVVVTKASFRLQEGDNVVVEDTDATVEPSSIEPWDLNLSILYEDDTCLVIDKPAGFAVHPGAGMAPGEKTILHGIAFLFAKRAIPFSTDAVLVHRLDRETTGCLLIAKDAASHRFLQEQFQQRSVTKQYLALVEGIPSSAEAMIDSPIGRSATHRTTMSVLANTDAREAQTGYRVLGSAHHASLLLCNLYTGRTHQVRVHLSAIGHPVLGDGTYTSERSLRLTEELGVHGLCLHAWKLTFVSPSDKKSHAVTAPLPSPFERAIASAGIPWKM